MPVIYVEVTDDFKQRVKAQALTEAKTETEWVRGVLFEWFQTHAAPKVKEARGN